MPNLPAIIKIVKEKVFLREKTTDMQTAEVAVFSFGHLQVNHLPNITPFVVSLSNHKRPFNKLRANSG